MSKIIRVRVKNKVYRVKDCKGFASVRGLMFDSVEKYDGALIYANNIWTPFCVPLDLFFLDKNLRVISVKKSVPITLDPKTWKTYSDERAEYCLEIKRK